MVTADSLPALSFILDERGKYLDVLGPEGSQRYSKARKLRGQRIDDFFPDHQARHFLEIVNSVLETGTSQVVEYELDLGEGRKWFEGRVSVAPKSLSDSKAILWISLDIHSRKQSQITTQESVTEMSRQIAEQSNVLHQAEAKALLQDRLAAVGQLAAGVAHDFNNMLTVILGFSELIQRSTILPEKAQGMIEKVVHEGRLAEQLIRQVLDFSRQVKVECQPLDLVPFIKESTKLLQQAIPEKIQLSTQIEEGEFIVNANLAQLQELITNLAINSRDAIEGDGEIHIQLSSLKIESGEKVEIKASASTIVPEVTPGDWVVLKVSDTGKGIPQDVMLRIFEPFFTTKPPGQGTGLGLSQVYGIVKQQEGFIDVHSETGQGTTITIYLKKESAAAIHPEPQEEHVTRGNGETILVVEDKESVLRTVETMLGELNYKVYTAKNGREALEVFETLDREVDAVLTDVIMPEMNGGELATELRNRVGELPIVMITGHQLNEDKESSAVPGLVEFLRKPIGLVRLSQAVKRTLGGSKAQ